MIKNPWFGNWNTDNEERDIKYKHFTPCLDSKREKEPKFKTSSPCITRKATPEEIERVLKERK